MNNDHATLVSDPIQRSVAGDLAALFPEYAGSRYVHVVGDTFCDDCPACLRHLPHTDEEHEQALSRNALASQADYGDEGGILQ